MGLADRLRARKLPTETVQLPLDPQAYERAERELMTATFALDEARARGSVDLSNYEHQVVEAQAAVDACEVEQITLRALPPAEWEALLDLHPPTDEQKADGALWNTTTFRPALLSASVVPAEGEQPLTESDWEQLTKEGQLAAGELNALFNTAININFRAPSSAVGKG